jgi:hypothetical protein
MTCNSGSRVQEYSEDPMGKFLRRVVHPELISYGNPGRETESRGFAGNYKPNTIDGQPVEG